MCEPNDTQEPMSGKPRLQRRRGKRDRVILASPLQLDATTSTGVRRKSRALQRHGDDAPSGGIQSLIPSLIGMAVLVCAVLGQMGFRGRASVAGIDLGTTNSVICVQAPAKGVGQIDCIPDPESGSPIIPSVVSFLDPSERPVGPSTKAKSLISPHPTQVVVGQKAKRRIDSHPHHTLYNAKRVLGRSFEDPAISELRKEVEFRLEEHFGEEKVAFRVPDTHIPIVPSHVGSYVVNHLVRITEAFLGHSNVKSAVICVPAKFDQRQRELTARAFRQAGISVARVVEEPTAAALAYGLHQKEDVNYILVYDFGGGTLDLSLLHVSEGYVEVMGSDGDDNLGGADFDTAVAHVLQEQHSTVLHHVTSTISSLEEKYPQDEDLEEKLDKLCPQLREKPLCTLSSFHTVGEQLKIELSDAMGKSPKDNDTLTASSECYGITKPESLAKNLSLESFCSALEPISLSLSSAEYNTAVQSLLDRAVLPITRLLKDLDITPEEIDEVVLVGGTTRMPHIRELVRAALPTAQHNTHIDPDITVAYGAASVID